MLFRCEDGTCSGAAGQRCATQPSSAMSTRVEDEDQGACALRFRCLPMLPLAPCSLGICPPPPVSFSLARSLSLSLSDVPRWCESLLCECERNYLGWSQVHARGNEAPVPHRFSADGLSCRGGGVSGRA